MRLNEEQAESFELLYASVNNALLYADVMASDAVLKPAMQPVLVKLRWLHGHLQSRVPLERRQFANAKDHVFYDELLRLATHLTEDQKQKLEDFIKQL